MRFRYRSSATRLVSLVCLLTTTACTTWRMETRPLPEVFADETPYQLRVVLRDSSSTVLRDPSLVADSVQGRASWGPLSIAVADIAYVSTRRADAVASAGAGLGVLVLVAGIGLVIFALTWSGPWGS